MIKRASLIALSSLLLTLAAMAEPVCNVVDGDTFHFCDGTKVRLDGIDAPEHGEPFYWEARRGLAFQLQGKDIQTLNCHTDKTGKRQACKVLVDGRDIQAELVKQGLAWDWPKYSKGRYASQENQAKDGKGGLWVNDEATQLHWSHRSRH